jgi:hypothetical protein
MVMGVFGRQRAVVWQWLRSDWSSALGFAMEIGLAVLFCISGIYAIPYSNISVDSIVHAKRLCFLGIMILLAVLAAAWRPDPVDRRLTIYCALLALVFAGNALFRQDMPEEYFYYMISIAFIWLFVRHVVDERFSLSRFMSYLRVGVVAINLLSVFVLIGCLSGADEIQRLVVSGFDGNRVNFSIWLWQIVFLNFALMRRERPIAHFLLVMAASSILLTIQVFTGGRIGVLATLATVIYFTWSRLDDVRFRFSVLGWLLLLVWVSAEYSPIPGQKETISVFRELNAYQRPGDLLEYVDRLLSHRVRIFINAVAALDAKDLLIGKGAGHFHVVADSVTWMVHNVFLKMLGEFGISVLGLLVALVWLPFNAKYRASRDGYDLYLMLLVSIMVGMLQPRFIVTGISNCLVTWLCYAMILKRADSARNVGDGQQRAS